MGYTRTTWQDFPNTTTPITAANLNNIEGFLSGDASAAQGDAFTPSWTNLNLGTGATNTGSYLKIGRMVWFRSITILGTGGSASGLIQIAPPVTPRSITTTTPIGMGLMRDISAARFFYGRLHHTSTTAFSLYSINATETVAFLSSTGASGPFTWTDGDYIYLTATYEAAA
jgi:hypothetical protein